jgi:hypothetical protein
VQEAVAAAGGKGAAHRLQTIAKMPKLKFEEVIETATDDGKELT